MPLPTTVIETAPARTSNASTTRIIAPHVDTLRASGISEEEAMKRGIFSVVTDDGLDKTTLSHFGGKGLTGLVFPLTEADGTTSYQMRLDDRHVTDKQGKYIQESGRGAILTVPKARQHLVGKATKIVIVEGTRQTIAADIYLPDEWLLVGIQGAHNFSRAGVPLKEIGELVPEGSEPVLLFDADWKTNAQVWNAAKDLQSHLEIAIGTKKPKIATIPGGSKLGLDDVLGAVPVAEKRQETLMRIIGAASPSLGRKPAARRPTARSFASQMTGLVVSWEDGQTRERAIDDGTGGINPGELVADFAIRTTATWSGLDLLNPDSETGGAVRAPVHSMEIATGSGADRREATLPRVPDAKRRDVDWLLAQAGPAFSTLYFVRRTGPLADLRSAISSTVSEDKLDAYEYRHTGWIETEDEGVAYLHNKGAIGAEGAVEGLSARLADGVFSQVAYPDPDEIDEVEAVRQALSAVEHFADPTALYAMDGSCMHTLSGARQRGVVSVTGQPGSGKSTVAALVRARAATVFAEAQMVSAGSTARAIIDVGAGYHHGWVLLDDMWKSGDSERARSAHSVAASALARRGYDGAGAGVSRLGRSADGDGFDLKRPDGAEPGFCLVGERMPAAETEDLPLSALERMLHVQVTREGTLAGVDGKAASALEQLAASGVMVASTAGYLRWVARQIEEAGSLVAWRLEMASQRKRIEEQLAGTHADTIPSTRSREVVGQTILGWTMWISYAIEIGALTEEEGAELIADAYTRLAAAMAEHVATLRSDRDVVLDRLRSAIASGRASLTAGVDGAARIGRTYTPRGSDEAYVALSADEVAKLLGVSLAKARDALRAVSTPTPTGLATWPISFGDIKALKMYCVPMSTWEPGDATDEAATLEVF